ncbi:dendritic cell-specific transmembrane protein-like [Arapaima gigas]
MVEYRDLCKLFFKLKNKKTGYNTDTEYQQQYTEQGTVNPTPGKLMQRQKSSDNCKNGWETPTVSSQGGSVQKEEKSDISTTTLKRHYTASQTLSSASNMHTAYAQLKQLLVQSCSRAATLYTRGPRSGRRPHLLHLATCFTVGVIFTSLLFVILLFSMQYDMAVSGSIAGACLIAITVALFLSKWIRCFVLLFLVSCGMKQGRNLLITAGTGLVIFWNVQNTFSNLRVLAMSLICNLEKKRVSFNLTALRNYIEMLKWIGRELQFPDPGVVKFSTDFQVSPNISSKALEEWLREGEKMLNATADNIHTTMEMLSSTGRKVTPALGVVLVCIFTALYLRQYHRNKKFENVFITGRFVQYDEKQKAEGRPHVLPLTEKEAKRYVVICATRPLAKEAKDMLKFCIPVLTSFLTWALFIGIDTLLYCLIVMISRQLEEMEPFQVPLVMKMTESQTIAGVPFREWNRTMDFSYSVALFERECLPQPSLLIHKSAVPLFFILLLLTILGLLSGKLLRLRLLVSAEFWPQAADVRVEHLHAKILRKRSKMKLKVRNSNLMTLLKKRSFWFPILSRHQKRDRLQLI